MVPTPHRDSYFSLTKALISIGRKNGFLLVDQLNDFLPDTASNPMDLEVVMGLFARLGIGIGATEEEAQAAREAIEPDQWQKQRQRQEQNHECAGVDRSLHIRAFRGTEPVEPRGWTD